ncbi:MAG: CsbD family protein [Actinobacteria bacterium]|nr:CsbD family protein [Actinomycetota bacterium]
MSIIDKITGKAKQALGDVAKDPSLRRQGKKEEAKGDAKERLDRAEKLQQEEAERVEDLERRS